MKVTIQDIISITKANIKQGAENTVIEELCTDTRKLLNPAHTLFFAIAGPNHDGHDFIAEAYQKGVRNYIVSKPNDYDELVDANVLLVKDSIKALQEIAAYKRNQFDIPIIGITGSNGKTIVKEWLYEVLSPDETITRSPKSFNSQVGVPLSVWKLSDDTTLGLFEAGISEPDEMGRLAKVIRPTIGVFTNIREAHAEGFLNNRHKAREKLTLFLNSKVLIYCSDYNDISEAITNYRQQHAQDAEFVAFQLFTWSKEKAADLQITAIDKGNEQTAITGIYLGKKVKISIPFTDDASIENAINCWATLLYMGKDQTIIAERLANLSPVAMRLELKKAVNNCSMINDSYNSDLASLSIALDFLIQQKQHSKKTVILSDILQSGQGPMTLYKDVANMLAAKEVDRLIGIGTDMSSVSQVIEDIIGECTFFRSTSEFIEHFNELEFDSETILLKGARNFHFESIAALLEAKVHQTVLEINLNAVANNLNTYRNLLDNGTKIMVMVKALSYGSGSYEIASTLQFQHADYLAVAYADEGVTLRKAGITLPIMVMNPEPTSYGKIIANGLEPVVYNHAELGQLLDFMGSLPGKKLAVHIELDTGMKRLGFEAEDMELLIAQLKSHPEVEVKSIFSHLAGSDDKALDDFSHKQIARFDELSEKMNKALKIQPIRHIVNSAGITRFKEAHFDMVRLGLGLYGIDSSKRLQGKLQAVSRLKATISQIKTVAKGETVGYNCSFSATRNMRTATVGIGYADGVDRRLSNGVGKMLVNGQEASIIGAVCMDMCMLDITDIEGVVEGDEVIVFGPELPVEEMAKWIGTIPYEILTGVSERVKRVYYHE